MVLALELNNLLLLISSTLPGRNDIHKWIISGSYNNKTYGGGGRRLKGTTDVQLLRSSDSSQIKCSHELTEKQRPEQGEVSCTELRKARYPKLFLSAMADACCSKHARVLKWSIRSYHYGPLEDRRMLVFLEAPERAQLETGPPGF